MQPAFPHLRSSDQAAAPLARHRVVIVGAGPVGLVLALDLAGRGVRVVLIDDADRIGEGSRAICFSKRTLEIFDRLGVAEALVARGVTWKTGRVFHSERELYAFDLLPESGHKQPAFINIAQSEVEAALVAAAQAQPLIDLRWLNRLTGLDLEAEGVRLTIATPDGPGDLTCDWLVACDGARSQTRALMGLAFEGEAFEDRFLIADVRMRAQTPTERRFWFAPPFHDGQSALLHRQPDDVWRVDLQLGPGADPERERRPEVVRPRIERMLGHADFELVWTSVYRFQCRRLARFVHGRVVFAGDAAHQVSPFGARGANSGVQDADSLGWRLAAVLTGRGGEALVAGYDRERVAAADENMLHSTRATDFIAPRSPGERRLRDAALALAAHAPFARAFVNSGRLSVASAYRDASGEEREGPRRGDPLIDGPLAERTGFAWLSEALRSGLPVLLACAEEPGMAACVALTMVTVAAGSVPARRYALPPGEAVLLRPDGHVSARLPAGDGAALADALARMMGDEP